jgi:transcriptional regulator with XRE-family HTH domain
MQRRITSAQTFGTIIKDERKKKNFSQDALGKLVGVDKATVSYIENGKPGVRLSTILLLLSALEMDLITQPKKSEPQSMDAW